MNRMFHLSTSAAILMFAVLGLFLKTNAQAQTISTCAGGIGAGYSGDGAAATAAHLNTPSATYVDTAGNLFTADAGNGCIRKITPSGIITTRSRYRH